MKEKLDYYRSLSTDDLITLPMEQFQEYLSLLIEAHNKSFHESLNEVEPDDLGLNCMDKQESQYWIEYIRFLPNLVLSHLHLFVRKMTDTPLICESLAIDFFHDMEEICMYSICSRFADASPGPFYRKVGHNEHNGS